MHAYLTYCLVLAFAPYSLSHSLSLSLELILGPWLRSKPPAAPALQWWSDGCGGWKPLQSLQSPDIFQAFPRGVFPTLPSSQSPLWRRVALSWVSDILTAPKLSTLYFPTWGLPNSLIFPPAKLGCNVPMWPSEASCWLQGLILRIIWIISQRPNFCPTAPST